MRRVFWFSAFMAMSGAAEAGGAPVELKPNPIKPGDVRLSYTMKINADGIKQVDFHVKYMDGSGKVLTETDVIWQNIVGGEEKPIEKGQSYTGKDRMPEGTAKADAKLLRAHFKDGKVWTPGK